MSRVTESTLRDKRRHGSPITINELILVYRRHTSQYYRKNGKVTREATITDDAIRYLRKHHATTFLDEFGPVMLDQLRNGMIEELDWSRKHINKQVGRIVRMFKWAAKKELVDASVPLSLATLGGLKKGRTNARESVGVTCVDDAIVDATLPHLPDVVADMVRIQRLTGARPGEICSLRPCDLDQSSDDVWLYIPFDHKTDHHDKGRIVVLGPKAKEILAPYLIRSEDEFCFSPKESEKRRREKIASSRTTPINYGNRPNSNRVASPKRQPQDRYVTDSYRRAIHRVCERHNIEKWSPNQLRHTSATEIRRRFGIEAAQVICGHERADVTQVYAERDLELAKKVARVIG
ncbi:MAG: site-specific integrase [Pirellulaceae bacterium]